MYISKQIEHFWVTYGELCSDMGDPIKVALKNGGILQYFSAL
jgi:hypothetical protein